MKNQYTTPVMKQFWEAKKAHPVIFWLIVIFSAQNILFYLLKN